MVAARCSVGHASTMTIVDQILVGDTQGIESLLDASNTDSDTTVRQVILPAARQVVNRYAAGEVILPSLLRSFEVVHRALEHLGSSLSRGTVVIATLEGD